MANQASCWICEEQFKYEGDKFRDVNCPNCGVENSIYNPADYKPYEPDGTEREEDMILGVKFVKVSDFQTGDLIKFLNEGEWVESKRFKYPDGSPKQQLQFQIEDGNGEKKILTLNKINRENLIIVWGYDTKNWVGKMAEVILKEVEVAGENKTVIRLKASE